MANCCGAINRGLAALGETLTWDHRRPADRVDVKDGSVIWEAPVADGSKGYCGHDGAARREGQSDCRSQRIRISNAGIRHAYNAKTGNRSRAFTPCPRRRARQRHVAVGTRRWRKGGRRLGRRQLQSRRSCSATVLRDGAFGGGVLSTATGLVFASDDEGNFRAVNSSDGQVLWDTTLGASPAGAAPMTYMLDGRQWIVTAAGSMLRAFRHFPQND